MWQHIRALIVRDSEKPPPLFLKQRSSTWFITSTVSIAVFTDIFLYAVIVPVVPFALTDRAGIQPENVQYWISVLLAVYGAALFIASPICGWVADRTTTRRAPLLVGLLALAGSTLILCFGRTIGLLLAGRALQGISAAIVWTTGLALLADTVGKDRIGQMMGYVFIGMSCGVLLAPLLGGIVFAKAGYYAVFGMAFGIIGFDVVLRVILIEQKQAAQWLNKAPSTSLPVQDRDDCRPSPTSSNGKPRDASPVSSNQEHAGNIDSIQPTASVPLSGAELPPTHITIFPREKPRFQAPPVLVLLKSRRLLACLWATLVQAAILTSFDSTLPLRVKTIWDWNSIGAGLIFLSLVVPTFVGPYIGNLSDRYGPRYLAAGGYLLTAPCLILLRFVTYNSISQKVLLCAILACTGFTVSLALSPITAEITYIVVAKERAHPGTFGSRGAFAQAYGLFNMSYAAGCVIGPLWAGLVNEEAGWATMSWTLGLLSAFTCVPTFLMVGGWYFGPRRDQWEKFSLRSLLRAKSLVNECEGGKLEAVTNEI